MTKTVLIVEDNQPTASALAELCEARFACCLKLAITIDEAQRCLKSPVALALLDVKVAGGCIFPFAARLTQCHIPFVFISAVDPTVMPRAFATTTFLQKPVQPADLLSVVGRYLN